MTRVPVTVDEVTDDGNNDSVDVVSDGGSTQVHEQQLSQRNAFVPLASSIGRMPLVLYLSCDPDYLSPYQVLLRQQIEFFEALESDVRLISQAGAGTKQGRTKPIVLGQVGIRCMHCYRSGRTYAQRTRGAMYFPATLHGIYQAAQNMAAIHFLGDYCQSIPEPIKANLHEFRASSKTSVGYGKSEWARRATVYGVYEDDDFEDGRSILRFHRYSERLLNGSWPLKEKKHKETAQKKPGKPTPKAAFQGVKRKDRDESETLGENRDPDFDLDLSLDFEGEDEDDILGMIEWNELELAVVEDEQEDVTEADSSLAELGIVEDGTGRFEV